MKSTPKKKKIKKPLSKKAFNKIDEAYFKANGRHKRGRKSANTTHDRSGNPLPR